MVKKKAVKKAPAKKASLKKAVAKKVVKKAPLVPSMGALKKAGQLTRSLANGLELAERSQPVVGQYGGTCWITHPDSPVPERVNVSRDTCARIHGRWQPD